MFTQNFKAQRYFFQFFSFSISKIFKRKPLKEILETTKQKTAEKIFFPSKQTLSKNLLQKFNTISKQDVKTTVQ